MTKRKVRKRPIPIAPKPIQMKSRKKARQVTSLFHKLTRQIDDIKKEDEEKEEEKEEQQQQQQQQQQQKRKEKIKELELQIEQMGGREEYQRASQLSTKFHSTSRWVLKTLGKYDWLNGIPVPTTMSSNSNSNSSNDDETAITTTFTSRKKRKLPRRKVNILEVGAINTELLDAAKKTKRVEKKKSEITNTSTSSSSFNNDDSIQQQQQQQIQQIQYKTIPLYNIQVKAIDIRSTHESIQEQDFLTFPITSNYDVIVCSMVLNCVTTAIDRGRMIQLLYQQLQPNGGLCFLTIPKLCLQQSRYIDRKVFEEMIVDGVGFEIVEKKDSPKVAFWILRKQQKQQKQQHQKEQGNSRRKERKVWKKEWEELQILYRGKKYRNEFGVVLKKR